MICPKQADEDQVYATQEQYLQKKRSFPIPENDRGTKAGERSHALNHMSEQQVLLIQPRYENCLLLSQ